MTRAQRFGVFGLCVLMAGGLLVPPLLRGAPARRSPDDIVKDLSATDAKIAEIMPSLASIKDPVFRNADGQKVVPLLKQMIGYFRELEAAAPDADTRMVAQMNRYRYMALVSALGDRETTDALATAAKATGDEAVLAQSAEGLGKWLTLSKDAQGQLKLLEDFDKLAKANPTSDVVAGTLGFMANVGPADNDVTKKIIEVIRTDLKGEAISGMVAQLESVQAQIALVGKPLDIAGRTSTGGSFSLASYKGKVVLVDFWATWCGPCVGELPNVKAAYKDNHDKGFEIIGVSCDSDDATLNSFTQENQMPWVQLREQSQNEADNWSPIAKRYSVDGIPAMFLVDKKGILRYVDAREDLAGKVKQLLDETDAPAKPVSK